MQYCSLNNQLEPPHGHSCESRLKQKPFLCRQGMAAYAMHEGFQHQLQLAQSGASSFVVQVTQGLRARDMSGLWHPVRSTI